MAEHMVICIARQFGSGGREIGFALAQAMGIPFYDKELLKAAAEKSGVLQDLFEKADERPTGSFGSEHPGKAASYADYTGLQPGEGTQAVIAEVIRDAADKSDCVIIGRCADYVLRGRRRMLSVFIHANLEARIFRIAHKHKLEEDAARALIRKTDRIRANYYYHYTERDWGTANNYDLALDAGRLGIEPAVALLQAAARLFCGPG